MSVIASKADFVGHMTRCLISRCEHPSHGVEGMRLIQLLSGMTIETVLLFDEPDAALEAVYGQLAGMLASEPEEGVLCDNALPSPDQIDRHTEHGRALARRLFEDWLHCPQEFLDISLFAIHQMIVAMEQDGGQPRAETFRLYIECANRCLAYEIAAQELCDIVIDQKIGEQGWSLVESISGLCAVAGRSLALSFSGARIVSGRELPAHLDKVAFVMTQEAIRLGIPAGTDWRFGLAANDTPCSAPYELIAGLEPVCHEFFQLIGLHNMVDQAVACAKASGRMLALAAGGERPELEPVIAKPLAMAALTETYRTVCREYAIA